MATRIKARKAGNSKAVPSKTGGVLTAEQHERLRRKLYDAQALCRSLQLSQFAPEDMGTPLLDTEIANVANVAHALLDEAHAILDVIEGRAAPAAGGAQ